MVLIGEEPILIHIMRYYASFGHVEFLIALGYKSEIVFEYFKLRKNFEPIGWKVTLVDTGLSTSTGGRIKKLQSELNEEFMLTYGDGVADLDIDALIQFHEKQSRLVTVTAVHPGARFGELQIDKEIVTNFAEKPQIQQGWINGGFFVMEPGFIDYIENDTTILEREPLESIAQKVNERDADMRSHIILSMFKVNQKYPTSFNSCSM